MKAGLVTYEEALNHVTNPDDFALRFRGIESTSDATWDNFEEGEGGPKSDDLIAAPTPSRREGRGERREAKEEDDFIQQLLAQAACASRRADALGSRLPPSAILAAFRR